MGCNASFAANSTAIGKKTTQQTARVRLITGRRELCRRVPRLCHLWHRHAILRRGVAHAMEKCHMENQGHQKHFGNSADLSSFVMSGWPSSSWAQSTRAQTHRMTSLRPAAVTTLPATDEKNRPHAQALIQAPLQADSFSMWTTSPPSAYGYRSSNGKCGASTRTAKKSIFAHRGLRPVLCEMFAEAV